MTLTRADLAQLPSYVPGRTVPGAIKLASNEVPYGPLPGVVDAVVEAADGVHRYPDMGVVALRQSWPSGSASRSSGSSPAAARSPWPSTWSAAPACPATRSSTPGGRSRRTRSSRRPRRPPRPGTQHRGPRARPAGHGRGRSPTARAWSSSAPPTTRPVRRPPSRTDGFLDTVGRCAGRAGRGVPGVRDRPGRARRPGEFGDRPNVVVLRTLSKAWGLAGLRIGYLVGQPEWPTAVRKVITPFSTTPRPSRRRWPRWTEAEMRRRAAW